MDKELFKLIMELRFQPEYTAADIITEIMAIIEQIAPLDINVNNASDSMAIEVLKQRVRSSIDPRFSAACIYVLDKLLPRDDVAFFIEDLHKTTCAIRASNVCLCS